jgi:hypothetical protein
MKNQQFRLYRFVSLVMAVTFAAVGLVFLFLPDGVLEFFNRFSPPLGLSPAPVQPGSFFPILAVAYMYVVTCLSWLMYKKPEDFILPLLLAQGKFASSILSLLYFFGRAPYLICLANAFADGFIGALALRLFFLQKKQARSWPT